MHQTRAGHDRGRDGKAPGAAAREAEVEVEGGRVARVETYVQVDRVGPGGSGNLVARANAHEGDEGGELHETAGHGNDDHVRDTVAAEMRDAVFHRGDAHVDHARCRYPVHQKDVQEMAMATVLQGSTREDVHLQLRGDQPRLT